ncbi:MAG TPA: hypothetical protein VM165_08375 [Planctomycetaceae bacterium]|nr:hypothetical protein [Planctomycetaceae bacterium]
MANASPLRSTEAPRICYRRWCWFLIVGLVIINGGYVLSWPFAVRSTTSGTIATRDPRTGQIHTTTLSNSPAVQLDYGPMIRLAHHNYIPLLTPCLWLYENKVNDFCRWCETTENSFRP